MNLLELQEKVNTAIQHAIECEVNPEGVTVSIRVEPPAGDSLWSDDVTLYYDNDGQASGCVLVGDSVEVTP